MWRLIFIGFFIAHGGVHLAIWATPKKADAPFDISSSWLLGVNKGLALGLAVGAAVLLIAAGLGLWAHADWWRAVAVLGLGVSFGLMVVYFHPWYLFIQAVNAALIVGLAWLDWPTRAMVGT